MGWAEAFEALKSGKPWDAFISSFGIPVSWFWTFLLLGTGIAIYFKTQSVRAVWLFASVVLFLGAGYLPAPVVHVLTVFVVAGAAYLLWQVIK